MNFCCSLFSFLHRKATKGQTSQSKCAGPPPLRTTRLLLPCSSARGGGRGGEGGIERQRTRNCPNCSLIFRERYFTGRGPPLPLSPHPDPPARAGVSSWALTRTHSPPTLYPQLSIKTVGDRNPGPMIVGSSKGHGKDRVYRTLLDEARGPSTGPAGNGSLSDDGSYETSGTKPTPTPFSALCACICIFCTLDLPWVL